MRRTAAALASLALAAWAVARPPATGADAPARKPRTLWDLAPVSAFLEAHRAGDEAAMARIAGGGDVDAVALAYGVWLASLPASGGAPAPAASSAPRAVARLAAFGPPREEVEGLVAAWTSLSSEAVDAERRAAAGAASDSAPGQPPDGAAARRSPTGPWEAYRAADFLEKGRGDPSDVSRAFLAARDAARALPWPDLAAKSLQSLAGFEMRRARYAQAEGRLDEALGLGYRALTPFRRALVLSSRAETRKRREAYEAAHEDAGEARRIFLSLGDRARAASQLAAVARILVDQYRDAEARATAEKARAECLETGSAVEAARMLAMLGLLDYREARLSSCLAREERALAEAEATGDAGLLAQVLGNLGEQEALAGYAERARAHVERSRGIQEARGDRVGALRSVYRLAEVQLGSGDLDGALRTSRSGTEAARALGLWRAESQSRFQTGEVLVRLGRLEEALEGFRELARFHAEAGRQGHAAYADERAASTLVRLGRAAEAARSIEAATAALDRWDNALYAASAHATHGRVLAATGKPAEALAQFARALEGRRRSAGGFGETDPEARAIVVRDVVDPAVSAALALARASTPEAAAAAFPFLEAARASILAEALANRDAFVAARLSPELAALERESRRRVEAALSRGSSEAGTAPAAGGGDLGEAYRLREEALSRIGREARDALAWIEPPRPSLAEVRAALAPGEALVEYHAAGDDLAALVATREEAALVDLGSSKGLDGKVHAWVDLLSAPGSSEAALSAALYDRLLRPLEPRLSGAKRLLVAPDGALAFAPFAALARVEGGSSKRVAERLETVLVPSATTLVLLRREAAGRSRGRGVVAVGDPAPAPGADPLPASAEEAKAVAAMHPEDARTLLVGAGATVAAVREALARAPARLATLHLAAHGVFDADHPRLSGLVLAGGARLDFDELSAWRAPADLAVLSACETARGRLRAGEGVLGLARPFFLAGCPRVVVSAWRVSDRSSLAFMTRFHEGVAKSGLAPAAALRAAQADALARGGEGAHPFHWAAYSLWGLPE
jgi:tetratricopeptide (TPR) repeat protein